MNLSSIKLGKRAPRFDKRTLLARKYMGALPPAPVIINRSGKMALPAGMMLNDSLGDCTCAGMGHFLQLVTANASTEVTLPDADILAAYEAVSGYEPGAPGTDVGAVEIDVLNYWRNTGIGPGGHKIAAYAAVNPLNHQEVMQALNLFGGLYIGINMPVSAQDQVGHVWDVMSTPDGAPGSWGGHCVVISDAQLSNDPPLASLNDGLTCVTWGALQKMTWAFWDRYVDEVYAVLTPDWIEANSQSPSGFDIATLQTDLASLV